MDYSLNQNKPIDNGSGDTPRAAAGIVLGALAALILIRRGFRGVNVGGVSVGVR
jgi:uncharacterized membrane protein